jgi:signal transduction histidine kinase
MAIVYQLVRDHSGKVLVESELNKGTTITIKLPVVARVSKQRKPPKSEVEHADSETVAVAG